MAYWAPSEVAIHLSATPLPSDTVDRLGRRYTWIRRVGGGGSGEVYLAWMRPDVGAARYVAVKVFRPDADRSRLQHEAEVLASVFHPVIVAPIDGACVELGGRSALVTEFVEGQDLSDCLEGDGIPATALVEVVEQVASALHTAWTERRVVHCDVKPSNIRIGVHGNVKLLDFGVAQLGAEATLDSVDQGQDRLRGTLPYLAPERFSPEVPAGPPADVFALGCVLFRGLAGEDLIGPRGIPEQVREDAVRFDAFVDGRLVAVEPPALRGVLAKALRHDPAARPTATELAEQCSHALSGMERPVRLVQWCRGRAWPESARAPSAPPSGVDGPSAEGEGHPDLVRLLGGRLSAEDAAHVQGCVRCTSIRGLLVRGEAMGPYRLIGKIGEGGMSRVYAAVHGKTGQLCALKRLKVHRQGMKQRVAREAKIQAIVQSAHVLPLLDAFEHRGSTVLVLPYVPGPSLAELSKRRPLLPEPLAAGLFAAIVEGVAAVHRRGIVHRDLKPSNVLLDPSSGQLVAKIADFGLAKALEDAGFSAVTHTQDFVGTPQFAAPEQWAGAKHVGAPADVYALGLIATQLFAGRSGERKVPEAWRELVLSMVAEDPADRPADAEAVRASLPAVPPIDELWVGVCRRMAPPLEPVEGGFETSRADGASTIDPEGAIEPSPGARSGGRRALAALVLAALVLGGLGLAALVGSPTRVAPPREVARPAEPVAPPKVPPPPPDVTTVIQSASPAPQPAVTSPPVRPQRPSPEPAPPPPEPARVTVTGEGSFSVRFTLGEREWEAGPGRTVELAAGTYRVEGLFPLQVGEKPVEVARSLVLEEGGAAVVRCNAAFARCAVE